MKMETELLRLRAALASLNLQLSLAVEAPREMVEEIAARAEDTAQEIKRRRDNFLALARADLAGAPPPPVAMSDTAGGMPNAGRGGADSFGNGDSGLFGD